MGSVLHQLETAEHLSLDEARRIADEICSLSGTQRDALQKAPYDGDSEMLLLPRSQRLKPRDSALRLNPFPTPAEESAVTGATAHRTPQYDQLDEVSDLALKRWAQHDRMAEWTSEMRETGHPSASW
jgi:hypothetical protein